MGSNDRQQIYTVVNDISENKGLPRKVLGRTVPPNPRTFFLFFSVEIGDHPVLDFTEATSWFQR